MSDELLLTVQQLADLLQVDAASIYHWSAAGRLPGCVRLSARCLRFRRLDVEKWLEELAQRADGLPIQFPKKRSIGNTKGHAL